MFHERVATARVFAAAAVVVETAVHNLRDGSVSSPGTPSLAGCIENLRYNIHLARSYWTVVAVVGEAGVAAWYAETGIRTIRCWCFVAVVGLTAIAAGLDRSSRQESAAVREMALDLQVRETTCFLLELLLTDSEADTGRHPRLQSAYCLVKLEMFLAVVAAAAAETAAVELDTELAHTS
jgi:hypothetical protein